MTVRRAAAELVRPQKSITQTPIQGWPGWDANRFQCHQCGFLLRPGSSVTISFRLYKSVIQGIQKSEEGHPFKAYLDVDIAVSSEAFHNHVNAAMVHINRALKLIIRLFLVEDLVDSLKLNVFVWLMTYVGAVFNGITLLILAELLIFSVPIDCEKYKTQIDHYVGIAHDQTKSIVEKIQAKLPGIEKKKRRNKYMETRNATVTKTPLNSYNVITCTLKELHSKLLFLNLVFSPLLSLYPQYQAQELLH
ncbi:reticulon-3-like isoform X1 [Canis lupus familiaris]|uniref:reticulon-3-like isoform X1 n=1 Tax=Canis lupus familiaris TaxID=9615 RepID=UPI0018F719E3|nr:reticulon-3-like isoform X1 [Canis lupus familiaris]